MDKLPIVVILVDGLMDNLLSEAIKKGYADTLASLCEHGLYNPKMIAPFPSLPICLEAALLTGTDPVINGIKGYNIYCPMHKNLVNIKARVLKRGIFKKFFFVKDHFYAASQTLLNKNIPTLHETAKTKTGSLGLKIYRGTQEKSINLPWIIKRKTDFSNSLVQATHFFSLGSFSNLNNRSNKFKEPAYGITNENIINEFQVMINRDKIPQLTLMSLPDLSYTLASGKKYAINSIRDTDNTIFKIMETFGSIKKAISNARWLIIGGGKTFLLPITKAYIDLDKTLQRFKVSNHQKHINNHTQIIIAQNERSAFIHIADLNINPKQIANLLQTEKQIDIIAWYEEEAVHVISGTTAGKMRFYPDKASLLIDHFGQHFTISGDKTIIDIIIEKPKDNQHQPKIIYGCYPDILNQLWHCFINDPRAVVITCAPGYKILDQHCFKHDDVSSGSMHSDDVYTPLIACGTNDQPNTNRITDIAHWILSMMQV